MSCLFSVKMMGCDMIKDDSKRCKTALAVETQQSVFSLCRQYNHGVEHFKSHDAAFLYIYFLWRRKVYFFRKISDSFYILCRHVPFICRPLAFAASDDRKYSQ